MWFYNKCDKVKRYYEFLILKKIKNVLDFVSVNKIPVSIVYTTSTVEYRK